MTSIPTLVYALDFISLLDRLAHYFNTSIYNLHTIEHQSLNRQQHCEACALCEVDRLYQVVVLEPDYQCL